MSAKVLLVACRSVAPMLMALCLLVGSGYSTKRVEGRVIGRAGVEPIRVIAISGSEIVGETPVDAVGGFKLEVARAPDQIVAHTLSPRVSAVAKPPAAARQLALSDPVKVRFQIDSFPEGAVIALDPIELAGFPSKLLWALRTHGGGVIDLHLIELILGSSSLEVALQRGKYRVWGGVVTLRPLDKSVRPYRLSELRDVKTGATYRGTDGEVVIDVQSSATYHVVLTPG